MQDKVLCVLYNQCKLTLGKNAKKRSIAHPMTLPKSQAVALQKRNCADENNGNDINWDKLNEHFNLLQYSNA